MSVMVPMRDRVYLTALHELGHALGLSHSDRFGEAMYAFRWPADPVRVFYADRKKLRSTEDIGSPRAIGLSEPGRWEIEQGQEGNEGENLA